MKKNSTQGDIKLEKKTRKKIVEFLFQKNKDLSKRTKSLPSILNFNSSLHKANLKKKSSFGLGYSLGKQNHNYHYKLNLRSWSSSPQKNHNLHAKLPRIDIKIAPNLPKKLNQMSQVNSAESKSSFAPYGDSSVHEHNHRYTPHLHYESCDRYLSGFDKNRHTRFYFTKGQTPCRVYLSYNEKLISPSADFNSEKEKQSQINAVLNGRKLSPKTLKNQLKISPNFIEDAKNFIFIKESMSLIPPIPQLPPSQAMLQLSMAEMAVLPFNLPNLNLTTNKSKNAVSKANKISSKLTSSSTTSLSNSDTTTNKSFNY